MGTHLRELTESSLMNTNMTGFGFSKITWTKVAIAMEGLNN